MASVAPPGLLRVISSTLYLGWRVRRAPWGRAAGVRVRPG